MQLPIHSASRRWPLLLALGTLLGGCTNQQNDPAPVVATTGIRWTVDNASYTSTSATVTDDGFIMKVNGVYSANGTNHVIQLSVPAAVGVYNTAAANTAAYFFMAYGISAGNSSVIYAASNAGGAGVGTVTVTTFSATDIAGTFSFTGAAVTGGATKVITDGRFALKR